MPHPIYLRLVTWVDDVDFRRSEKNNWLRVNAHRDRLRDYIVRQDDAVLLISKSRKMGAFIWGSQHSEKQLFAVVKFWCPNGFSWNMLQNYANEVGIELRSMRTFEEHFVRRYSSQVASRLLQ